MVGRVLQVVYKEIRGLHQAAYVLALFTIGSQALALIRDRLLAHQFGAGIELDLYYAAFRIPDLLYVLFASTLSVYVLIPFITDRIESGTLVRARKLLSEIFTLFLVVYSLLALLIAVFAPYITPFLFPGFEAHQEELVLLLRILLLQPFFLGISSLYGVITQMNHRFILYALSPLVYNIGIIAGLIFLYPILGLSGLVFGVVLGAVGHVFIQMPFIVTSELAPRITRVTSWGDIKSVLMVSVPRSFTLSLHQIVLLCLVGFASLMTEGSVSVLQFGFNLQSVPLAIIGVSYSVAAFPMLAKLHAEKMTEAFSAYILTALRHIIFWSLPILAIIIVVRAQFVRVILGTGAFDWDDTRLTAAVLALFLVSLVAQAVNLLVVRALYAVGNTKIPFYTTFCSSVLMIALAFFLNWAFFTFTLFREILEALFRVSDVQGTEVLMLPLAYTLGMMIHSIVLLAISSRKLEFRLRGIVFHSIRSLVTAIVAGLIAYGVLQLVVSGLRTETLLGIFLQGLLAGIAGILGAVGAYYLQRSPELAEVYKAFHKRIFKTDVVAPQDEDHLAV